MRHIDLPFQRSIQAMHEIDAVATARALVTHLRRNGANDTLIDNEERSAPNGDLVKALMFLLISQVWYGFDKINTHIGALGSMFGVIIVNFEPGVRKTKGSNKLSIGSRELCVRGHPSNSVIGTKETCSIELMNGGLVKVMLKCKWSSKTG